MAPATLTEHGGTPMPTKAERLLIESLENQAALINRYLDRLARDLRQASAAEAADIQTEIEYQICQLARVHAERSAAQRRLAAAEGKRKGGDE